MKAFIDTGAFLAIADKSDTFHELSATAYQKVVEQKAILYTSNYIIDETITLIRARVNHNAAVAFIKGLEISNIKVLHISEKDEQIAKEIFIKYKDKDFSYTDCTSFTLIDKYSLDAALSLDEHFSHYSYKHGVRHLLVK
jgi:predicted nucleic acid-binding protein